MAVVHFISGHTLDVAESIDEVREALCEPAHITGRVALASLQLIEEGEVRPLLVQPSSVAYVLAD